MINEANLKNAVLARAILTRSDLGGADIEGTDFTNALVDRTQQLVRKIGHPFISSLLPMCELMYEMFLPSTPSFSLRPCASMRVVPTASLGPTHARLWDAVACASSVHRHLLTQRDHKFLRTRRMPSGPQFQPTGSEHDDVLLMMLLK